MYDNDCNTSLALLSLTIKAQTQQTNSFGVIINGDRQESSLEYVTANNLW